MKAIAVKIQNLVFPVSVDFSVLDIILARPGTEYGLISLWTFLYAIACLKCRNKFLIK